MKCTKCGSELIEGHLYCEKCGEEIKIVPEFDPEFEMQINETIVNLAKDVATETQKEELENSKEIAFQKIEEEDIDFDEDFRDMRPHFHIGFSKIIKKNMKLCLGIVLGVLCVFVLAICILNHSQDNSYEYQYRQAVDYANHGDIENAIYYMERALAINPENTDGQFLLADYYDENGQTRSAILILQELIEDEPYNIEDVYTTLVTIYEEEAAYQEIGNLLKDCTNTSVLAKYNKYVAKEPAFNKPAGEYEEMISITMSGNTEGVVYYTLNGTTPNITSEEYENPILLDSGKYTIKAMFINTYGVQSDVVTMQYEINIIPPEAPIASLESGSYDEPQLIEIYYDADSKVFYTVDGSIPTSNSLRYTEPLEMPVGVSNYKFIAINEEGTTSEVLQRSYQLTLSSYITPALAKQVLLNNLQVNGIIQDQAGHIADKLGTNTYEVTTAVKLNGSVYYIIVENYVDTTGMIHNSNNLYAIDATTGDPYYAWKIGEGQYTLRAL